MKMQVPKLNINVPISCDLETTGLIPWLGDSPFAISMSDGDETFYWQFEVDPYTREVCYEEGPLEYVESIVSNPNCTVVMHNAKFDCRMLEMYCGIKLKAKLHDTSIMARVAVSNELTVRLKALSKKYLGIDDADEKDLQKSVISFRRQAKKLGWNLGAEVEQDYWIPKQIDKTNNLCEEYAVKDAIRTIYLYHFYKDILSEEEGGTETYQKEMDLWPIVYRMEAHGTAISESCVREEMEYNEKRAEQALRHMYQIAGSEFNPASPSQLAEVLYSRLALPVSRRTPGGGPSTDWKALRSHFGHPFVHALMDWRSSSKGINFFDKFLELSIPDHISDDKNIRAIHASFNQASTVTGRFSCTSPNLQQIQSKENNTGAEAPKARKPFIPRPGYEFILADYMQLQLRIFAEFSQEPTMLAAIAAGRDIHDETTEKAWGGPNNLAAIDAMIISLELRSSETKDILVLAAWNRLKFYPDQLTYSEKEIQQFARCWLELHNYSIIAAEKAIGKSTSRKRGKNINFGKIFGGEAPALQDLLFCTYEEANKFITQYRKAFPTMQDYIDKEISKATELGYVFTPFGRKLRIDPETAYTTANNYKVQGSEADLVKLGMRRVDNFLQRIRNKHEAYLVMQIHDELCIESKRPTPKWVLRGIKTLMENHDGAFTIDMPVEISIARESWDKKVKVEL